MLGKTPPAQQAMWQGGIEVWIRYQLQVSFQLEPAAVQPMVEFAVLRRGRGVQ